jgi:hypothetical protein
MKILYANADQPFPAKRRIFQWFGCWLAKDDGEKTAPKDVFVVDFIEFEEEMWWLCTTNRPRTLFAVQNLEPKGRCVFVGPDSAWDMSSAEREQMYAEVLAEGASLGPSTKLVLSTVPLVIATFELISHDTVVSGRPEGQTILRALAEQLEK